MTGELRVESDPKIEHYRLQGREVALHVAAIGPQDGPLVIFLHGFPEYWAAWIPQMRHLAAMGFRVLAPDQRGYNESDKPDGIAAYSADRLANDIVDLIDGAGRRSAAVVAHDWGGAIAWTLGIAHPDRVSKLVIINCPHPFILRQAMFTQPAQFLKSWYVFFFQLPFVPEWLLSRANFSKMRQSLVATSRAGAFKPEELDRYVKTWSRPGALTAMLNWYRAAIRKPPRAGIPASRKIACPTLLLWGERDRFLETELARKSLERCEQARLQTFPKGTHWICHEIPDEINRRLGSFLAD